MLDRIERLATLHSEGMLSHEEFAAAKHRLLGIKTERAMARPRRSRTRTSRLTSANRACGRAAVIAPAHHRAAPRLTITRSSGEWWHGGCARERTLR